MDTYNKSVIIRKEVNKWKIKLINLKKLNEFYY